MLSGIGNMIIYIYMVGNCIYYQRAQLQPGFQEPMRVQPRMVWQGLCHSFHQECWFRVTTTSTKNSAVIHLAQKTSCAHSVCPSCSLFVCSSKRLAQQNWSSRLQKWWTFCPGVSVTNSYLCIYIYIKTNKNKMNIYTYTEQKQKTTDIWMFFIYVSKSKNPPRHTNTMPGQVANPSPTES